MFSHRNTHTPKDKNGEFAGGPQSELKKNSPAVLLSKPSPQRLEALPCQTLCFEEARGLLGRPDIQ